MITLDIKERLEILMNERGWTIYRVAKEANIPWSTVRNMFKRNTEPSVATLECICSGMGITLSQFFDVDNTLGITDEQRVLLENYSMLSEKNKRIVSELLEALAKTKE